LQLLQIGQTFEMSSKIIPIIMCGGAGTRLWPASRERMPKQFMPLFGVQTLFQDTVLRVVDAQLFERPIVITGANYRAHVEQQLGAIGVAADVVLEPERRDSAPAVAVATVLGLRRSADALLMVLASDHVIRFPDRFYTACHDAIAVARDGSIVTFGIVPDHPSTDYGYLKPGAAIGEGKLRRLSAFAEKPDAATAATYVAAGHLWNSGNFLFEAEVMKEELQRLQPAIWSAASRAVATARDEAGVMSLDRASFASAPRISIDYALMEKTTRSAVLPVELGWSDLGSWDSVWANMARDGNGNAVSGPCELLDVRNSIVRSDGSLLAAVVGLENVVVVVSGGAVLVAPKTAKSEMKTLLDQLRAAGRPEAD
jgi:mannose-1-phosphate guanylyltransferase/mannose-6-phosphate isomerase